MYVECRTVGLSSVGLRVGSFLLGLRQFLRQEYCIRHDMIHARRATRIAPVRRHKDD